MNDRRSGDDRREQQRFEVSIDVDWEGFIGKQVGTISDISLSGCFVLCSGEVENGDYVKIWFPLTNGNKFELWGEIVNHVFEIGFGMQFIRMTLAQKEFMESYIDTLRND